MKKFTQKQVGLLRALDLEPYQWYEVYDRYKKLKKLPYMHMEKMSFEQHLKNLHRSHVRKLKPVYLGD